MRSHRSADLTVLRTEVATRLALPRATRRCRVRAGMPRLPLARSAGREASNARAATSTPVCSGSESRSKWHCYACRYQFSVTAGTLFHSSHLPVWKWFVAVHLMLASPDSLSANELRRTIGGSYKTAWFAAHRIRAAMRGHGAELLRNLVDAELRETGATMPPALIEVDRANGTVLARMRRMVGGPPPASSASSTCPPTSTSAAGARSTQVNPHVFRDTIQALLEGEGISYDRLVGAV